MDAKVTMVQLRCEAGQRKFELEHAERILNLRKSGWVLDDKDYELINGNISKRNQKEGTGKKGA